MSGVCLDALNPTGSPSRVKLNHLGVDSFRMEIRDSMSWVTYANYLDQYLLHYALVGPSTDNLSDCLEAIEPPYVVIIGNEPDNVGPSSWTMTPEEYLELWNSTAKVVKARDSQILLCAAGMLGDASYLGGIWNRLNPLPDIVNKHYPWDKGDIQQFRMFNRPIIVGEWCYKTATQDEMTDWVGMLNEETSDHCWFCWSNGMVDGMGLVGKTGKPTVAYKRYKRAIA